MACLSLVGSGRISLATTRLPTEQSFSTVFHSPGQPDGADVHHGRHCQLTLSATPPLLISRNEKKQIKQKVPRNGNFGWHSITPRLFRCHLTGLPWFPIYYRWPALQWRGLSGCLTVKLFHLFTICSLLFSPSLPPWFQPEYIFFSFFNYFPRRRLEQNQITEVPAKAFSAYKKLKRM
jgi:hypothetical protein